MTFLRTWWETEKHVYMCNTSRYIYTKCMCRHGNTWRQLYAKQKIANNDCTNTSKSTYVVTLTTIVLIHQRRMLVSPYNRDGAKTRWSSNGCISNYTTITWLGPSVTHFQPLFYPFWLLPLLVRLPKSPASNAKIANQQPAKKQCCRSSFFHFSFFL